VYVDRKHIFSATPEWIARRLRRERPDPGDRSRFNETVVAAIQAAVDRSPLLRT